MHTIENLTDLRSPYLAHVRRTRFAAPGTILAPPDGSWDIVILRNRDGVRVLRTGLTTRAVAVPHAAGDEILAIGFRASAYMPLWPATRMRDRGEFLAPAGARRVWVGTERLEIPTHEHVEAFVRALARRGLVRLDDAVDGLLRGAPKAMSERTRQRHFLRTTGVTYKTYTRICRAQRAAALLRGGRPAADVAYALDFADQSHMSNSLKAVLGQTPTELVRTDRSWFADE